MDFRKPEDVFRSIEEIREICGDDDAQLLADMIEGSTGLHELIDEVISYVQDAESRADGVMRRVRDLQDRKKRFETRSKKARELIGRLMEAGNLKKYEGDFATVSIKAKAPEPIILDESKIPAEYFVEQDPKLNRMLLRTAAKGGQDIPGVTLDNGGTTVTIRGK